MTIEQVLAGSKSPSAKTGGGVGGAAEGVEVDIAKADEAFATLELICPLFATEEQLSRLPPCLITCGR